MPRIQGRTTTATLTETAMNGAGYAEQTTAAVRSILSTSAADTAAGTGARSIRITYYVLGADGTLSGPLTETVIPNGTTAVPTVASNINLVEKMEVMTAGLGGMAAGAITLNAASTGLGSTMVTIAAGDTTSHMAHRYVPSNRRVLLTDAVMLNTSATTAAAIGIRVLSYATANAVETRATEALGVRGQYGSETVAFPENSMPIVIGPARIQAYVTAGDTGSQVTSIDLGYVEE